MYLNHCLYLQPHRSVVYMQDLESTLIYSLKHEIGLQKFISGHSLSALKAYVAVLNKVSV